MPRLFLTTVIGSLVLSLMFDGGCSDPTPASTATLGVVLNHMMDQLSTAILTARNAGETLEMEGGRNVNLAVANAQNAYADSLNLTMDKVDKQTKSTIDQLQSMVNQISAGSISGADDITGRAQQIVNSLPFRPHEPQITTISPSYVVPSRTDYPVAVRFSGNFEYAAKAEYTPSFEINSHKYTASQNSTQLLEFLVPVSVLFPASDPAKFAIATGTLTVPWASSSWGITHKHSDSYSLVLGALPASPGHIKLTHTVPGTRRVTKRYVSQNYHLGSESQDGNNDEIDKPFGVAPESGWNIARGTSTLDVRAARGDQSHSFVSDDGGQVIWRVTTIHHGLRGGPSGALDFNISFTEYQDVPDDQHPTEVVVLNWGDSRLFNYPTGTWSISFDAFEGSHAELGGSTLSNKFITVQNQGGNLVIGTADPKSLVWP